MFTDKGKIYRHLRNKRNIDQSAIDQQNKVEERKRKDDELNQQKEAAKKRKIEERKHTNYELNQQREDMKKRKVEERKRKNDQQKEETKKGKVQEEKHKKAQKTIYPEVVPFDLTLHKNNGQ